jgi:hypothetical protein
VTGIVALRRAAMLALGLTVVRRSWLGLWNAFGGLDLIVAVSLGALSMPGTPYRLFTEGPGTFAITTLPSAIVPLILVPTYLLLHMVIIAKLQALPRAARSAAIVA